MNKLFLVLIGLVVLVGFVAADGDLVNEVEEREDDPLDGGIDKPVGAHLHTRVAYDPSQKGLGVLEERKDSTCASANKNRKECKTCCDKLAKAASFTVRGMVPLGSLNGKCTCQARRLD